MVCQKELKKSKDEFALVGENKVNKEPLSIVKSILDSKVIQPCLPSMGDLQQHDFKVTWNL